MIRSVLLAGLFTSAAAFATGERINITGAAAPLKETLCISMNCVNAGGRDFTVTGRVVKGGIEVTVTGAGGQARLTHLAPLNAYRKISSTDLVRATALVVQAIERGPIASAAPLKKAVAKKKWKARPKAFFARR